MGLKVLTYNIRFGWGDRLPLLVEVIQAQQADVVALMEATDLAHVQTLARELSMEVCYGEGNVGLAEVWLSRLPVVRACNHRLTALVHTLLEVTVEWDGALLHLFATHLRGYRPGLRTDDPLNAQRRAAEARAILEVVRPVMDLPHLLVGDLNSVHPRDTLGIPPPARSSFRIARQPVRLLLEAGYTDCYRSLHPLTPGYTFPTPEPRGRLDYVLASPLLAARLTAADIVTSPAAAQASDHYPLWAEFS